MFKVASVADEAGAATEQVSATAQESSASTQKIITASEQLAGMTGDLEKLVSAFSM